MSREPVNGIPYAYKTDNSRHDACIPLEKRQAALAKRGDGKRPPTTWSELKDDFVTLDRLQVLRVDKEEESVKQWKENWSFLADFDAKGNPVVHEPLPEQLSRFSDVVPNTNSGNYGNKATQPSGVQISDLEWRLLGSKGKRKVDPEINCNY